MEFLPLADLPNQDGYRFLGHTKFGAIIELWIKKQPDGIHRVVDMHGNFQFEAITAWAKVDPRKGH